MPQRCNPCQEKAVEQTFVVDSSRLLSFAVGYIFVNQYYTKWLGCHDVTALLSTMNSKL
jgi:hypothetical protein